MRCIDADALIDKYGEWYTEEGTEEGYIGTIKGIVDSMPTIERKTGKWLETDSHEPCWFKCDQCGRLHDFLDAYCPNCGAIMERGDDHEND